MRCKTCTDIGREVSAVSMAGYCDACQWALTETGERIVKGEAAFLVALGRVVKDCTGRGPVPRGIDPYRVYAGTEDPFRLAWAAIKRMHEPEQS